MTVIDKMKIFKGCPLFQATNIKKNKDENFLIISLSAGLDGVYQLENVWTRLTCLVHFGQSRAHILAGRLPPNLQIEKLLSLSIFVMFVA